MNTGRIGSSPGPRPAIGPVDPPPAKPAPRRQDESTSQLPADDESVIEAEPEEEEEAEEDEPEQEDEEIPEPTIERVNGHPQSTPSAPAPPPQRHVDPVWSWSKSMQVLYEQFGIIKKKGGIDTLIEEWDDDQKISYLNTLKDVRERCDEYIPKLEKVCRKLLLTTNSNS